MKGANVRCLELAKIDLLVDRLRQMTLMEIGFLRSPSLHRKRYNPAEMFRLIEYNRNVKN